MSHIHIPESELNKFANILWHHAGKLAGNRVGFQVTHYVYDKIKKHLDDHDHDYVVLTHDNSPYGYTLLTYR
jgi:hypothetical protein